MNTYRVNGDVSTGVVCAFISIGCAIGLFIDPYLALKYGYSMDEKSAALMIVSGFGLIITLAITIYEIVLTHRYNLCLGRGKSKKGRVVDISESVAGGRGWHHVVHHMVVEYEDDHGDVNQSDIIISSDVAHSYASEDPVNVMVYGVYGAVRE